LIVERRSYATPIVDARRHAALMPPWLPRRRLMLIFSPPSMEIFAALLRHVYRRRFDATRCAI
jgi:hypothetical protein